MKQVHIIPHMHWDREWYFTTEESRILLVNNMVEILEMLENNQDYPYYLLDGQTAILEDYLLVCPDQKERIKNLVQAGKLIIGPWYTQTDEMIVGAESITRNLLYGIKDSEQLGDPMRIGYLPDSFGQSAQMPQILNGFNIHKAVFWRGISERHGTSNTEFYWCSDDGSEVLTQLLPLGYAIGKYLPEEKEELKQRMDKYFSVLDKGATSDIQVIPNGHDQMPIQKNIFSIIEKLKKMYPDRNFFLSSYDQVFEELSKLPELDVVQGELIDGKYSRVHRSIYSSRIDIKSANTRIENKITNILEPIASLAYNFGHEYHHGLIEGIWKEIMKNHAHDSIGCCCSDKVHAEILNRFVNAEERVDQLIKFYQRKIVEGIPERKNCDKLVVFNLAATPRKEVIETTIISKLSQFEIKTATDQICPYVILEQEILDPGLIDRQIVHYGNYDPFIQYKIQFEAEIPAVGYQTFYVGETNRKNFINSIEVSTTDNKIETDYYVITINNNGTFDLYDKKSKKTYKEIFCLEDTADDGDEYDYSPMLEDTIRYSKDEVSSQYIVKQSPYKIEIINEYDWKLPLDILDRKDGKNSSKINVSLKIEVTKNSPIISTTINIQNNCKDHRVRLLIPTDIQNNFSISDNQFGVIKRNVYDNALDVWQMEEWDERPDTIYPFLSHLSVSEAQRTVAVFTNSTREYQIIGNQYDIIAITLFRSVGVLGKEELVRRPGRPSGIKLPTPDSQLIKEIKLELGVCFLDQDIEHSYIAKKAKDFLTPIISYNQIPYNAMKLNKSDIDNLPLQFSLLEQNNPNIILSTIKKAEKKPELLARFYNSSTKKQTIEIKGYSNYQSHSLNEELLSERYDGELKPNQVTTIKLLDTDKFCE